MGSKMIKYNNHCKKISPSNNPWSSSILTCFQSVKLYMKIKFTDFINSSCCVFKLFNKHSSDYLLYVLASDKIILLTFHPVPFGFWSSFFHVWKGRDFIGIFHDFAGNFRVKFRAGNFANLIFINEYFTYWHNFVRQNYIRVMRVCINSFEFRINRKMRLKIYIHFQMLWESDEG